MARLPTVEVKPAWSKPAWGKPAWSNPGAQQKPHTRSSLTSMPAQKLT